MFYYRLLNNVILDIKDEPVIDMKSRNMDNEENHNLNPVAIVEWVTYLIIDQINCNKHDLKKLKM